jgi:tetratricopeptide (TPR) repeat protein
LKLINKNIKYSIIFNKRLILIILIIATTCFSSYSQSAIDSLENELLNQKEDTLKVQLLNKLGWMYLNSDLDQTTFYAYQAIDLSKKLDFKEGEAIAITHLGYVETLLGNFQNAMTNFNQSLEIFKSIGDKPHTATTYTNIANTHFYLSDYSKNIEFNNLSLEISVELKDSSGIANTYTSLGNAYLKLGDYPKSLDYFMNSLKIYDGRNDSSRMAGCYNNIAIVYKRQSDIENAMKYYQKALTLSQNFNNTKGEGEANNNIGVLYLEADKYQEALTFFENALSSFEIIEYQIGIATVTGNIGQVYLNLNQYDIALNYFDKATIIEQEIGDQEGYSTTLTKIAETYYKLKDFRSAKENAFLCLEISKKIKSLIQQNNIYKLISDIYKAEGNHQKSLEYLELYLSSSNKIFSIEKSREIENIKTLYEVEKKEIEIKSLHQKTEILEQENQIQKLNLARNRLLGILIGVALFIVILTSIFLISRQRMKIKKNKQIHNAKKALMDVEIKNINLEKNKLNSELEFRKKELGNMASHIIEKNNLIEKIEQEVSTIKRDENNNNLASLSSISLELNLNKNREDFNTQVEELHKDFFYKLSEKYPDLTKNEKKLVALLRMELSSKEISGILNISSKSVDMNRYRLRKKLNLDNEINILEFLKTI